MKVLSEVGTSESSVSGLRVARLAAAVPREDEPALVLRAARGDEAAQRRIYYAHKDQVRRHLFRLLGSDPDIDDVVQMVFVNAFGALDRFRGTAAISTWLYRITTNTTHNLLRQRFRRRRLRAAVAWFDRGREAHLQAPRPDARDEALRILTQLHPDLREVFVLYHYEGLTLQEIGGILGRPVSTVGDRLTRARKELKELCAN